ncbi:Ca2+-transporting ATPase [Rhodoblastus acidophilus]|uniref:Ca2+-transporting ATPase n=1 Tax=Rhodoblastus acidophilus TaxID=1074 RepID=A0A212S9W3_RHOAC|nr:cation-translocating P-type ATPase [Rhodoblastus acidophilus]PPQ36290.1 cation-translocating P-type ATPase [Rhodoblastus acidophilus]RAI20388.1 cation-translocating P-type ATPase [Rhodoblastus acidophilus]SNB82050.1 Ca2+-transporting ATPase [Rhodoblastus acidophilus]
MAGLTSAEAAARLAAEGPNELPQPDRRTLPRIALEVLREPMLALLIGGGALYLALGDTKEALILLVFAGLSVVISVVQEARTERVLEALRDLTSPRALVIRDGERRRIPGREVVRGDVIVLAEGDRVPADAHLVEAQDLQADESLLTGESAPVRKRASDAAPAEAHRPGGDDQPMVYSGALIVRGGGLAEVAATGVRSEIGKIGKSLGGLETEAPRLQQQTRRLVMIAAAFGGMVSLAVVALYWTLRGGALDALLAGVAIGMSMLPEEFPVVLTVFMAMGAWRISQARVLTRRATAIEALGAATVLCTDKTGTLTQNRMAIAELRGPGGEKFVVGPDAPTLPPPAAKILTIGVLASAREPFDPMEKAFHALALQTGASPPSGEIVRVYPLRPDCLAVTQVWALAEAPAARMVAAKGAPEDIAALCRLCPADRAKLAASVEEMAASGLRVLGVARADFADAAFPEAQADFAFTFLGLVGLADPIRDDVPAAVAECRSAGIRVVMITGDYPATALAIARQAGILSDGFLTGREIEGLSAEDLAARVRKTSVFARIMPDQKLRIVEAMKANGEVVAMTGDGVNDALSLKAAHIGVAMGGRGTDVAREASSIVLLDDDFGSIVKTVRLGRRIYDNLRKAMSFIFAVHVPIAGLALAPLLLGAPILFGPVHIAFLEMVIDPVCSLVFEAETEEDGLMRRPPRDPAEPLFSVPMIVWGLFQGAFALVLVGAIYIVALGRGMPVDEVRALVFFSLVIAIVALILVNRSTRASLFKAVLRPNRALAITLPAVAATLAGSLLWPGLRDLFRFGPLHADDLSLSLGVGLVTLVALESLKAVLMRTATRKAQ